MKEKTRYSWKKIGRFAKFKNINSKYIEDDSNSWAFCRMTLEMLDKIFITEGDLKRTGQYETETRNQSGYSTRTYWFYQK